jgi:SAM-dependent methyltransferase
MIGMVALCCPTCKSDVVKTAAAYTCLQCGARYPIIAGIADFRVYADPYIDLQADREKALRVAAHADAHGLDFAGVVSYYYDITPEVTPDQRAHFTAHHVHGVERGNGLLQRAREYRLFYKSTDIILEIGCGTSGLIAAAAQAGHHVIGVDVAFRWLFIGKYRLRELKIDALLIAACADFLPFKAGQFDGVIAENVIEHTPDAARVLREAARVLRADGRFIGRTVNRYAPAPEPYVNLWGVGLLPYRWQKAYIRALKGRDVRYAIRLLSWFGVRRALKQAGLAHWRVRAARMADGDMAHMSGRMRTLFRWYDTVVRRAGVLRGALTLFAPFLDIHTPERVPINTDKERSLSSQA